jgi:hypothetical protein
MHTAPLAALHVETLPFVIAPAETEADLTEVLRIRSAAYSRHDYPEYIVAAMLKPDPRDSQSVCLLARDKESGAGVATLRITSNLDSPLKLPGEMPLASFMSEPFSFVDKFGTTPGSVGQQAAMALMKAAWMWSHGRGVRWIAAIGLKPLTRRYETVGLRVIPEQPFGFIFDDQHPKPFFTVAARLVDLEQNVTERHPGLWPYFAATHHPDIRVVYRPAPPSPSPSITEWAPPAHSRRTKKLSPPPFSHQHQRYALRRIAVGGMTAPSNPASVAA